MKQKDCHWIYKTGFASSIIQDSGKKYLNTALSGNTGKTTGMLNCKNGVN